MRQYEISIGSFFRILGFVANPASHTPLTACILVRLLLENGVPLGFVSPLCGSAEVGCKIRQAAELCRTRMEFGSIACTILCAGANLDKAPPYGDPYK